LKQQASTDNEQLPFQFDTGARQALPARLRRMVPQRGESPFDDPDWFFEPWWPGTPAIAYVQDFSVRLQVEHLADPMAAFPELASIGTQFADDQVIVDGTLLVLDAEGKPDAELLRQRLADPTTRDGVPAYVVSDLLYDLARPLVSRPFGERRHRLSSLFEDGDRCVVSRGLRGEGTTLAEAITAMGLSELSARQLSAPYRVGGSDETWLRVPVIEAPPAPTRPLLALLQRLPL
jgi:bifunctional non-homologous end joining protein LigD